jgi:hypothetical protein
MFYHIIIMKLVGKAIDEPICESRDRGDEEAAKVNPSRLSSPPRRCWRSTPLPVSLGPLRYGRPRSLTDRRILLVSFSG